MAPPSQLAAVAPDRPMRYILTKYELTKVIGMRAEQLARGAEPLVNVDAFEAFDPISIAERELAARKLPFIVQRLLPDGKVETLNLEHAVM
jgi:DNA-directed RNA polymerase subunit K/omega